MASEGSHLELFGAILSVPGSHAICTKIISDKTLAVCFFEIFVPNQVKDGLHLLALLILYKAWQCGKYSD